MLRKKIVLMVIVGLGALILTGCQTTGKAIQGVGSGVGTVFNKTGGAIKNLG